jgi:biotin carboxyl carrier protein
MKRQVRVDNRTYLVDHEKNGDRITISVDGRPYPVDAAVVAGGFCSLLVAGRSHDAYVSREKGRYAVVIAGHAMDVVFPDPRARQPEEGLARPVVAARQTICAPMAGRIVRLQVRVGDPVQAGQGLVVLEAMKMENELKSEGIGAVKEILVAENDVVAAGQGLIIIE